MSAKREALCDFYWSSIIYGLFYLQAFWAFFPSIIGLRKCWQEVSTRLSFQIPNSLPYPKRNTQLPWSISRVGYWSRELIRGLNWKSDTDLGNKSLPEHLLISNHYSSTVPELRSRYSKLDLYTKLRYTNRKAPVQRPFLLAGELASPAAEF